MFFTSIDSLTLVIGAFGLVRYLDQHAVLERLDGRGAVVADLVLHGIALLAFAIGFGGALRRALGL